MAGRSSCPECGTILRIRDRSFVGRRVNCPECKTALRIETEGQDGDFVTSRMTAAELDRAAKGQAGSKAIRDKIELSVPPIRSSISRWINSPLTAAWLLAIAVVSLIAVLTLTPKFRLAPGRPSSAQRETAPRVETPQNPESPAPSTNSSMVHPGISEAPMAKLDERPSISALEPANVDGPLPWPLISALNSVPEQPTVLMPVPAKVNVESKMKFPFPYYKQVPISRRILLDALREQLDAPILYDKEDLGTAELEKTVTFELENTTVGGVIKTVADGAGWEMTIEPTGLRLKRKQPSSSP